MIIAIDFDGTITTKNIYPNIGEIRPYAKEVINKLIDRGDYVYLWTCREGETLYKAIGFLKHNGINLSSYNTGPSTGSNKLIADVYIDDAGYPNNGNIDWLNVAKYLGIKID